MYSVKIYGAGSIGNHLAHACRNKNWDVLICDIDKKALERTMKDIYPSRYNKWDTKIRLALVEDLKPEKFDLTIIGTPPDSHINVALDILKNETTQVLLIEKPLCTKSLEGCKELIHLAQSKDTFIGVGYNHTMTQNTIRAEDILKTGFLGQPLTMSSMFREHWGAIFSAHSWLDGPHDSYLGFCECGGGALAEHSHAINIWQHFSHLLGMGRIVEVFAMLDIVDDGKVKYDRICQISVRTEKGLVGNIVLDVITEPPQKQLRVQGTQGALEWHVNKEKNTDAVLYWDAQKVRTIERFPKTRPNDFKGEIDHIHDVLEGKTSESPISFDRGLETQMVIAAAHISNRLKKSVRINYRVGYCLEAIEAE